LIEIGAAALRDFVKRGAHEVDPLRHGVELGELRGSEIRPSPAGGNVGREAVEQCSDLGEAETELLCERDQRQPLDGLLAINALAADAPVGRHQSACLVVAHS